MNDMNDGRRLLIGMAVVGSLIASIGAALLYASWTLGNM